MVYRGIFNGFEYACVFVNTVIKMKIHSKKFIFFLAVVLVLVVISLGRESYRYFQINQEIRKLKNKIEELRKSNEELIKTREFYQSKEFLEEEARKKFGLVKEGENVIIVASGQDEELKQEAEKKLEQQTLNPKLWWDYFFKK